MKAVVISGASRGLGATLARRFAAPGVRLLLTARSATALDAVATECRAAGATVTLAPLDIADAAGVAAALAEFEAAGPVDLVIANAGMSAGTAPDGTPEGREEAARQIEVNLLGAINLVAPLLPGMRARGAGGVGLIASVAGLRGLPDMPAYCASKAGLIGWGEGLRAANRRFGIKVTVVAPGFFDSDMGDRFLGRRPFHLSLDAVAAKVEAALRRGAPSLAFPWPIVLALRALSLLPAGLADRGARLMRFRIAPDPRA